MGDVNSLRYSLEAVGRLGGDIDGRLRDFQRGVVELRGTLKQDKCWSRSSRLRLVELLALAPSVAGVCLLEVGKLGRNKDAWQPMNRVNAVRLGAYRLQLDRPEAHEACLLVTEPTTLILGEEMSDAVAGLTEARFEYARWLGTLGLEPAAFGGGLFRRRLASRVVGNLRRRRRNAKLKQSWVA
jgi:hypothetical protein